MESTGTAFAASDAAKFSKIGIGEPMGHAERALEFLDLITETVDREDGVFTLTKGPKGEYIASLIYGHEAPDSPMAGAHAIGVGNSAADAVFGMLREMGKV